MVKHKVRHRLRRQIKQIALERITILFEMARGLFRDEPVLAQRYVDLARKIGMRYQIRLPVKLRRMVCRNCKSLIIPGINCRVRIRQRRDRHTVITCLNCGKYMRIPLRRRGMNLRE